MATEKVLRWGAIHRIRALAGLLLTAAVWLAPSAAFAQTSDAPPPRPVKARDAMRAAQECYRRGDYEGAAHLYQDAEANKQQLGPHEKDDLADLIKANNTALEASRNGAARLHQADEALKVGNLDEAAKLVRAESANPYLKPADKVLLGHLTWQLRSRGITGLAGTLPKSPSGPDISKEDYATLVKMARTACQRGDYDTAEFYCQEAEKKAGMFPEWTTPWKDSCGSVMREVQAGRARQAAMQVQVVNKDAKPEQPSFLNRVKSMLSPASAQAKSDAERPQPGADKNVVAGPAANSQAPSPPQQVVSKETLEARALRDQAIEAIKRDDLPAAKKYAEQAKAKMDPNAWWEAPSPDDLLRDINRHLSQVGQAGGPGGDPGRQQPVAPNPGTDAASARARLKEARILFAQAKLDEADRLCAQAGAAKVSWGLFEDNPERLRTDIKAARQKADKAESVKLLAEARKSLAAGNTEDARAKAWKAKQLHGPYNLWDLSDRPDKLLADIDVVQAKLKKQNSPGDTNVAKNNQNLAKPGPLGPKMDSDAPQPAPVSVAALTAKQRAQGLLEEAHAYQRQGRLADAHAKASAAQAAAVEAAKGGFGFGPGEESPDLFLYALAGQAKTRIDALVRVADDNINGAANDATRLTKAADSLTEARQLAVLFRLDVAPIDVKLACVTPRPPADPGLMTTAAAQQSVSDNLGLKLLDDARGEIKAGRLDQARKFAEEALDAKYAVQKPAEDVLRSIEVEAFQRRCLEADRAFANAHEAFLRGEYKQARTIVANLDERLLSPLNSTSLREMNLHPEMQISRGSAAVKVAGGPIDVKGPGMANASDLAQPGGNADNSEFAAIIGMNRVEFDKFTKECQVALRTANQKAEAGDLEGAIDTLRGYKASLGSSGLEPEQVAVLQKPVDRYVQQFETRKAKKSFQEQQTAESQGGLVREKTRTLHNEETQAQVAKLADQANQLMRERKFEEAQVAWLQVKELDPDNLAAQSGIFESNIREQEKRNAQTDHNQQEFVLKGLDANPGPYVDTRNPSMIDANFHQRSANRKELSYIKTLLKDPKEQAIERALWEKMLTLGFNNVPLYKCIEDIKEYVGGNINIVIDDQAVQAAGIHMDQPVTMTVTEMNLKSTLNHLLKKAGLTYAIRDQSITITTEDNAKGKWGITTYSVPDLVVPIESKGSQQVDLVNAHWQAAINQQLNGSMGGSSGPTPYGVPGGLPSGQPVGSPSGGYGAGQANTLTGKVKKPVGSDDLSELLIRLITTTISPESWSDVGGKGTIQYFPLGMALVVNQTPDIQEQIIDLLTALRRLQDLEVAIEMRLVSVSESFYEFMGVNFNMNIPTGTVTQGNNVQTLVNGNYAPNQLINSFRPNGTLISGVTPAGTLTPNLGVPISTSSFGYALPPFGGYPGTLGADGGLSLGLAFLSDIQVSMFMEAAQGDRRTNVMQAPKITVFNGQTASINVGDELYFLTSINVIQVNGQMVFQPQQNPVPYGVLMSVTPVVSADRRFVRLNLNPTLQNLVSATVPLLPVQQIVPQLLYDNISPPQPTVFTMFFQQPSTSFITLNTTVQVPDGGTVLMGGLKTLVEGRNEAGPPVLSKIPYLSRLFTNVGYGRETQSLMIMVTARIIINEEEELEFLGQLPRIPRS